MSTGVARTKEKELKTGKKLLLTLNILRSKAELTGERALMGSQ